MHTEHTSHECQTFMADFDVNIYCTIMITARKCLYVCYTWNELIHLGRHFKIKAKLNFSNLDVVFLDVNKVSNTFSFGHMTTKTLPSGWTTYCPVL